MNYSKEWMDLLSKKEAFEKAAFDYNNSADENKKKNDLKMALDEIYQSNRTDVIRMMAEGHIFSDSIELVIEEVVKIAILGHEECIGWAGVALNHLNKKKWGEKIVKLITFYTDCNIEEEDLMKIEDLRELM
jgi:carbonic anhydrase